MILMNVRVEYIYIINLKCLLGFFQGELATRLSQFGPVRIEWPAENNRTRRRTNHGRFFFLEIFH
jgi:hypothetical protein